ncbi:MAG: transporter [Clostridia bacterium]|jgi:predicted permease|nr:transporter [Clostridia bacterium]
MENLIFAINVVLPLFLMMLLGYILTKLKFWDTQFIKAANRVSFKLFLPILLFSNIYEADRNQLLDIKLIVFSVTGVLIVIFFATLFVMLFIKDNRRRGVLIQAIFRSNFLIFGIALSENIFGSGGAGVAAKLVGVLIPLFNFCAVIILEAYGKENKKNISTMFLGVIKNPLIIGCVLGILTVRLNIAIPKAIEKSLHDIGTIGAPLAVLMLGAGFNLKGLKKDMKYILIGMLGKLVVVPIIALGAALFLGFRNYELVALLAAFGSPVAINSYIMAEQAGADSELAGELVVATTFLAPFTLCLFIFFFKEMGFIG